MMTIAVVTGSAGLVGSEASRFLSMKGLSVIGIDNDMRSYFFGTASSTDWIRKQHVAMLPNYVHSSTDIRDLAALSRLFEEHGRDIVLILHAAAQPSHDWAAHEPMTDFGINANGTLNLLELTRRHCPNAAFVFMSTNKVYGDTPNGLPLIELETRLELPPEHPYAAGIGEDMSIDHSLHSLFGASKLAADILVQEYGRYFGMKTVCFRAGCITGSLHAGAELHGFLNYLVKCALTGRPYTIFGYGGKQVRDNIHARDLCSAFWRFYQEPQIAVVYNIGGGRAANCSVLEAIAATERVTGSRLAITSSPQNRTGDHRWWISDVSRFQAHYPGWNVTFGIDDLIAEIACGLETRLKQGTLAEAGRQLDG